MKIDNDILVQLKDSQGIFTIFDSILKKEITLQVYEIKKKINFFSLFKSLGVEFEKIYLSERHWHNFGSKYCSLMPDGHQRLLCLGWSLQGDTYKYSAVFHSNKTVELPACFQSFSVHGDTDLEPLDLVVIPQIN